MAAVAGLEVMASNCLALNTKVFFQTTGANQVIVNHHMALRAKQSDAVTASTAAASALAASPLKPGGVSPGSSLPSAQPLLQVRPAWSTTTPTILEANKLHAVMLCAAAAGAQRCNPCPAGTHKPAASNEGVSACVACPEGTEPSGSKKQCSKYRQY